MKYGLSAADIQKIKQVFASYAPVRRVVIYGSRAKGNYKPYSDIDLTLSGEGLSLTLLGDIENDLDDLLLPYKIDLSDRSRITDADLLEHIARVGQVFYAA